MGLRPDIPCKKHKNGSIELYATIANTKRGCAYFDTPSYKKTSRNYYDTPPQPFRFLVPSQLVSSLLEPPPLALTPQRPPAARSRLAIKSLVTVIASHSYLVRVAVRSALKGVMPLQETFSNRWLVAVLRCLSSVGSSPRLNASATIPQATVFPSLGWKSLYLLKA